MCCITISGDIASGKSTVARELCKRYNMKYFSMGSLYKSLAKKEGVRIEDYFSNASLKFNKLMDQKLVTDLKGEKCIIDARMGWYLMPQSLKIYLKCDEASIISRLCYRSEYENFSHDDLVRAYKKRREAEKIKFRDMYNVDFTDLTNYDLVIDTTYKTVNMILDVISHHIEEYHCSV